MNGISRSSPPQKPQARGLASNYKNGRKLAEAASQNLDPAAISPYKEVAFAPASARSRPLDNRQMAEALGEPGLHAFDSTHPAYGARADSRR